MLNSHGHCIKTSREHRGRAPALEGVDGGEWIQNWGGWVSGGRLGISRDIDLPFSGLESQANDNRSRQRTFYDAGRAKQGF